MKLRDGFDHMNTLGGQEAPFFFAIDFEMKNVVVHPLDDPEMEGILFDVNGIKNHNFNYGTKSIPIVKGRIPFMEYKRAFDIVTEGLQYGNSFLTNLTRATKINLEHSLLDIFLNSSAKYKLLFKDKFVVFSPEPFIKIEDNVISSYPMKGTANANIPDAAQKLMDDEKELSEHYTIVDLIRNDLSIVAENVIVSKFRYLEQIESNHQTLYQLSSKIEGDLDEDWKSNIGSMLRKLLPAGSISGAPKRKTIEIIENAEKSDRGYYTGVMGLFDGKSLDSGVMIRFIEKKGNKFFYRSGGGITFQSDLNKEYSELIDKIYVPIFGND